MVTGHNAGRRSFALASLAMFRQQTWANKELVIINTGQPLLAQPESDIIEVTAPSNITLGALRNIAFDHGSGEWLTQWDDDDWSHPTRIETQMKGATEHGCCVLHSQIRCNLLDRSDAFVHRSVCGIEGTILHHRRVPWRYPDKARSEDTDFMAQFNVRTVVLGMPWLYVRFYHGRNTWHYAHIMRPNCLRQALTERESQTVTAALATFNP